MKDIYIINERGPDFWGTHQISEKTQYGKWGDQTHQELNPEEFQKLIQTFKNKRILIYIHGLRNTKEDLCCSFETLKDNIIPLTLKTSFYTKFKNLIKYYLGYVDMNQNDYPYDIIIGYSWPSFDNESYYYNAKEHAIKLAPKLSDQLFQLSKVTSRLDVMAHSMGNLLLFEALSKHANPNLKIDHIYSVAPAVPSHSLNTSGTYSKVLDLCEQMFVFHTQHDFALGWPFYLAENRTYALGLLGPDLVSGKVFHKKLKSIDSSQVIKGHSDYFYSDDFYKYLSKIHNNELDLNKNQFRIIPALVKHQLVS